MLQLQHFFGQGKIFCSTISIHIKLFYSYKSNCAAFVVAVLKKNLCCLDRKENKKARFTKAARKIVQQAKQTMSAQQASSASPVTVPIQLSLSIKTDLSCAIGDKFYHVLYENQHASKSFQVKLLHEKFPPFSQIHLYAVYHDELQNYYQARKPLLYFTREEFAVQGSVAVASKNYNEQLPKSRTEKRVVSFVLEVVLGSQHVFPPVPVHHCWIFSKKAFAEKFLEEKQREFSKQFASICQHAAQFQQHYSMQMDLEPLDNGDTLLEELLHSTQAIPAKSNNNEVIKTIVADATLKPCITNDSNTTQFVTMQVLYVNPSKKDSTDVIAKEAVAKHVKLEPKQTFQTNWTPNKEYAKPGSIVSLCFRVMCPETSEYLLRTESLYIY